LFQTNSREVEVSTGGVLMIADLTVSDELS